MLIISNFPFGCHSQLSTAIQNKTERVYPNSTHITIAPQEHFKKMGIDKLDLIKYTDTKGFEDVDMSVGFMVGLFRPYKTHKTKDEIIKQICVNSNKEELFNLYMKIKEYNKGRKPIAKFIGGGYKGATYNIYDKDLSFVRTERQTCDGVVHRNGYDNKFNVNRDYEVLKEHSAWLYNFNSKLERENFTKWWYKDPGNRNTLIGKLFLFMHKYNGRMLSTCRQFLEYFPKVDWTREWTDEEIYKEIGYEPKPENEN